VPADVTPLLRSLRTAGADTEAVIAHLADLLYPELKRIARSLTREAQGPVMLQRSDGITLSPAAFLALGGRCVDRLFQAQEKRP
jgi:hypothetical protein